MVKFLIGLLISISLVACGPKEEKHYPGGLTLVNGDQIECNDLYYITGAWSNRRTIEQFICYSDIDLNQGNTYLGSAVISFWGGVERY